MQRQSRNTPSPGRSRTPPSRRSTASTSCRPRCSRCSARCRRCKSPPDEAWIDGNRCPKLACRARAFVQGDRAAPGDLGRLHPRQDRARRGDAAPARALSRSTASTATRAIRPPSTWRCSSGTARATSTAAASRRCGVSCCPHERHHFPRQSARAPLAEAGRAMRASAASRSRALIEGEHLVGGISRRGRKDRGTDSEQGRERRSSMPWRERPEKPRCCSSDAVFRSIADTESPSGIAAEISIPKSKAELNKPLPASSSKASRTPATSARSCAAPPRSVSGMRCWAKAARTPGRRRCCARGWARISRMDILEGADLAAAIGQFGGRSPAPWRAAAWR